MKIIIKIELEQISGCLDIIQINRYLDMILITHIHGW